MGYERKFYIVSEWDKSDIAEIIAEIDMSKLDYETFGRLFKNDAAKAIYLLESNYDEPIAMDKYGASIKSEYPNEVLMALARDYNVSHYWREKVAIDLISSVMENSKELLDNERIMIYSYGY